MLHLKLTITRLRMNGMVNMAQQSLLHPILVQLLSKFGNGSNRKQPLFVFAHFRGKNLFLLQPPKKNNDQSAAGACTVAMQYSKGGKSMELKQMAQNAIDIHPFSVKHTSESITILCLKGYCGRNLLTRSVAYEILNKILLLPSHVINKAN